MGLFFRNRGHWQLNYIPRKPKAFITSKNLASHLWNECDNDWENPVLFPLKRFRDSHDFNGKGDIKGIGQTQNGIEILNTVCFNITFVFTLFNCLKLKTNTDCFPSDTFTILDAEKNAQ